MEETVPAFCFLMLSYNLFLAAFRMWVTQDVTITAMATVQKT